MFDYLVASVVVNPSKDCRFGVEERVGMLREVPADLGMPKREVHSPGVSPLASVKDADLV